MNGHEYHLMEGHTRLRRRLSGIGHWESSTDWESSWKCPVQSNDAKEIQKKPVQLLRFVCKRPEEEMVCASSCRDSVSRTTSISQSRCKSQEWKTLGQQTGKPRVDFTSRECDSRMGERLNGSARCFRGEKPKSKTDAATSGRDSSIERNCRLSPACETIWRKPICRAIYPPIQALDTKNIEDLRVRQFPEGM